MQRKGLQATLLDGLTADLGGPRMTVFFDQCQKAIPWQRLADSIADIFPSDDDPSKAGRPHWSLGVMVKCMMLAKWFGLSDPQLEEALRDRLSFRRFVGLSLADATPDETTFVIFRRRLREHGHASTLFEATLQCLRERNLIVKEGTLVDATIIEAPLGNKRADGTSTKDPAATTTKKHGRTYNGFKAHVATDKRGIIKDYVFDTARSSDHEHADELMKNETKEVYADSGYMSKARSEALKKRHVFPGIAYRRVKGQKELTAEQRAHNRLVAGIRAFVEHPFAWMRKMNFWRARYRGLVRNALDFAMRAIAYNLKRSLSLTPIAS
jgi:transposase, IS5 family